MTQKKIENQLIVTTTPLLPIEGFPEFIQEFITTCTSTYQTPRDYWASGVIIATALGIGDKIVIKTKYTDAPILWLCNVGDVSIGKTEPLKLCLQYFEQKDNASISTYNKAIEDWERTQNGTDTSNGTERPRCFQYILKDATPEAMAEVHSVNSRGIIYYRDELKGWIDDFGRYNKSGEQSNMLSSFNQVSMPYNRKGSARITNIPKPFILVAGGIQPDLLPTLAKDARAESGFLARFVFAFPDNPVKPNYSKDVVPPELFQQFGLFLESLAKIPETITLKLGEEAELYYAEWFNHNAETSNATEIGYLKGVYGKFDIICIRIAIVIRGMNMFFNSETSDEITFEEMKAAVDITEYFRATALKVYDRIFGEGKLPPINRAQVIRYLVNEAGLPKTEVARLLGVERPTVYRALK
ncbi:MAG: DUF3987 domain-containing protein [Bacteroidales bacterium]|nr:DUF3987 domain-containing protein [Bacteroidales bacterium]